MNYSSINFEDKLAKISEQWSPRIIAQMNDYHFKVVKLQGDFVWHHHAETDEVFIVLDGAMTIEFRDGKVDLHTGEMFVLLAGGAVETQRGVGKAFLTPPLLPRTNRR